MINPQEGSILIGSARLDRPSGLAPTMPKRTMPDYVYSSEEKRLWRIGIVIILLGGIGGAIGIAYQLWGNAPGAGYSLIWAGIYLSVVWRAAHKLFIGKAWKRHVKKYLGTDTEGHERQVGCWAKSLARWNLACAIAHVSLSIALFFLIGDTWPVKGSIDHFAWEPIDPGETRACSNENVTCRVTVETTMVGELYAEWIVFAFHMLSGLAHVVVYIEMCENRLTATPKPAESSLYMSSLLIKMNPLRWFEYFFSASLMQVVIMLLTGYTNVWILALSASAIAITQVFGYASEAQVSKSFRFGLDFTPVKLWPFLAVEALTLYVIGAVITGQPTLRTVIFLLASLEVVSALYAIAKSSTWQPEKWVYYMCGWISFSVPWVAVYYSFYDSIGRSGDGPPDWVRVVVWSLVLLFACFAIVMGWYLYRADDRYVSFYAENAYLVLSLVSKASLAFQLWYGLDQRSGRGLKPPDPTRNCTIEELIRNATTNL